MNVVTETFVITPITATTQLKTGNGAMGGIFVSSCSSTPTITVYDNTSATGTPIVAVFTPAAGTFYALPGSFSVGLRVVISGTVSCSVFWK